jgi:predicted RNase H-like HicB family nuclease
MHGMISASEDGKDAIATHVQGMIEDHAPIPTPQTTAKYVDISFSDSAA